MADAVAGFASFPFTDGAITHTVYRRGSGPAVVLMHELPGMTPACIGWARELSDNGFTVYMPLLFGKPNDDKGGGFLPQLCISREFRLLAGGGGSPIVTWLRALGRHALGQQAGPGIGVIGMCLTGNFAVAMMADETVLAPVASQPALPLTLPILGGLTGAAGALAVTPQELATAQQRAAQGVKLMCLRFSNDRISPVRKFEALRNAFGPAFFPFLLGSDTGINSAPGNSYGLKPDAHSVLTGEYQEGVPDHPSRLARNAVIGFLTERLVGVG